MIPFLKSVARAYASRYPDMSEMCFLFPNKRSGTFFIKYLKEECGRHVTLSPEVRTITEFVADLSERVVAPRLDLLFMLYMCYRELRGMGPAGAGDESDYSDFDSFRGWGETVISDFNEIDMYLADAEKVFKNVKDYRDLASNFLTEEQKEVMEEYFGKTDFGSSDRFWKNFDADEESMSDVKKKFLYLWRQMSPLYELLNRELEKRGLATSGGCYRMAALRLQDEGRAALPYKKVVAVGFNALSSSEAAIFSEMRGFEGYAGFDDFCDCFWDSAGPVLTSGVNSASRFVAADARVFPSPEWAAPSLAGSDCHKLPRLRAVASPSNAAQVKIAGMLLSELRGRLSSEEITGAKVAVVLPDENLLLPMLYSLPEGMGDVNLTMGYPLRLTSVVPFVRHFRQLCRARRKSASGCSFYHRDLRLFLSHPFCHALFGTEAVGKILGYADARHMIYVGTDVIGSISPKAGEFLDFTILDHNPREAKDFLDARLVMVEESLPAAGKGLMKSRLEKDHIEVYRDALRRLGAILEEYGMAVGAETFFSLADRLLSGESVGFEGEPLTGLQVMGTLETRSIDFDYLMILSMNEKIMPMKARTRSFIPDSVRHDYGLPPSSYAEAIFAYYFYRMISRAKEVTMIYDARVAGGTRGGDVSRYILQLRHLFARGVLEEERWKFRLSGKTPYDPSVVKTEEIVERLGDFMKTGPGSKNFSASALSAYRECQVKFFYQSVMGIDTDPDRSDYIDAIGVGNILHALMESLYLPEEKRGKYLDSPVTMDREKIEALIADRDSLLCLTTRIINREHYLLREDELDRPLSGASEIIGREIMQMAVRVMERDLRLAPFRIFGCEIKEKLRIHLPSGKVVNFKFAIDRLDEITVGGKPLLRIIDYKTGGIKLKAESMEEVISGDYHSSQIFQLFTYAWLLDKTGRGRGGDVRMEIYDVPRIFRNEENLPVIADETVGKYGEKGGDFSDGIEGMLESVFSDAKFEAPEEGEACAMCRLKALCGR